MSRHPEGRTDTPVSVVGPPLSQIEVTTPPAIPRAGPAFLGRAILIGLALMPVNAYWITEMEIVHYAGHPTTVSLFFNVVFIILVLFLFNSLLRRIGLIRWTLSRSEIIVIYAMLTIGSALVSHDMIQVLTPQLSHPYHFATPENEWERLFFPYLPAWLGVRDDDALRGAYEGGTSIAMPENYRPWLIPIFWWSTFIIALVLVTLCLATILRKRWTDEERLSYPIAQIALELTDERNPLYRDRLLWIGFAIAALIDIMNGFNALYPSVPPFKIRYVHYETILDNVFNNRPWVALSGTRLSFHPFAIGLGMLLPVDLLFSCWFFYLFSRIQRVLGASIGWDQIQRFPWADQQGFGAYMGIAVFGLWIGRSYFRDLFARIFHAGPEHDRRETVTYRLAFIGVIAGLAYLIGFAWMIGMSLLVGCVFFAIYVCLSISVSRIRAELGPPAHDLHNGGPDRFLSLALGVGRNSPLGVQNQVAMKLMFWFNRAYRGHPMPPELEALKMGESAGISRQTIWIALLIAGIWGTLCGFWSQLFCFYRYGMSAKIVGPSSWAFGPEPFNELRSWLVTPQPADGRALNAMLFGFLFTLALNALRIRLSWFPFHPVGYATSMSWSMNILWMPMLIAWLIKATVFRYGGARMSRRILPLAIGLVLGEFVVGSLWTIYGAITGKQTYGFWV